MNKLHKNRLLKLAKFLEKLPEENFDMSFWMRPDRKGHLHKKANQKCGTTACALGWATAVFPELYYNPKTNIRIIGHRYLRDNIGRETAEVFFGLELQGFNTIFLGNDDITPKEEATIIKNWIKTGVEDVNSEDN